MAAKSVGLLLIFVLCVSVVTAQEDEEPMDPETVTGDNEYTPYEGFTNMTWAEYTRCGMMQCSDWERRQRKMIELQALIHKRYPVRDPDDDEKEGTVGQHPEELSGLELQLYPTNEEVVMREEEIDAHIARLRGHRRAKRAGLGKVRDYIWKLSLAKPVIAYELEHDTNNEATRQNLRRTVGRMLSAETCIKLKEYPRGTTDHGDNHWGIVFTAKERKCSSSVGKVLWGSPNSITMTRACYAVPAIATHEVMHALNFYHEQERTDRDEHITYHRDNILPFGHFQFLQGHTFTRNPYDLNSIMQYGQGGFARPGKVTYTPKNRFYRDELGQRKYMTFWDAKTINLVYCRCRNSAVKCAHGGYPDPNDCNKCKCAPGFSSASNCRDVLIPPNGCGKTVHVSSDGREEEIRSPSIHPNTECNYHVKAPDGYRVQLRFTSRFSVMSWLNVLYEGDMTVGPRYSGHIPPTDVIVSEDNEMMLSAQSVADRDSGTGFTVKVSAVRGSGSSGGSSGGGSQQSAHRPTTRRTTTRTTTPYRTTTRYTTTTPYRTTTRYTPYTTTPYRTTTRYTTTRNYNEGNRDSNNGGRSDSFSCNFDSKDWCGITQDTDDQFDWTLQRGETPSGNTGPSSAYNGDYYIFIEASDPNQRGDKCAISLPAVSSSGTFCLSFQYNMNCNKDHISKLSVFKGSEELWSKFDVIPRWEKAEVRTQMSAGERIRIVGERGGGHMGDSAIDDISLRKC